MLNRIMLILAVVVSIISAASTLFGKIAVIIAAVASVIGFVLCLILKRYRAARSFAVVFPIALIFCLPMLFSLNNLESSQQLIGKTANISGYVCEEPEYHDGYTVYTIKTKDIDISGYNKDLKLRITSFDNIDLDVFHNIVAKVTFNKPNETFKLSNYADGIYLSAYPKYLSGDGTVHKSYYSYAVNLRRNIRNIIYSFLPFEEASVINGIMLGDKDSISNELYSAFKGCGIVHIVSVSGLHLSVICYSLLTLLKRFKLPEKLSYIICAVSVLIIMAVTGFSPSIMRSAFMFLLMLLGRCLYRNTDTLNLLGCSVVINLFINPFTLFNVGFQLSVLSTAGIIITVPRAETWFNRKFWRNNFFTVICKYIYTSVAQCFSATLFTLPVLCYSIGYFSVTSPIASILLIYPSTIILICSVIAAILGLLGINFLVYPFLFISGIITKCFIYIIRLLDKLPITTLRFGGKETLFCIIMCFLLATFCITLYPNRRTVKLTALGVALILSFNVLLSAFLNHNYINVKVLSLTSGHTATVISSNNNGTVVICPQMSKTELYTLSDMIDSTDNVIDVLIIPETNNDMRQEMGYLTSVFDVECIMIGNKDLLEAYKASKPDETITDLYSSKINLNDQIAIESICDQSGTSFIINSKETSFSLTYPIDSNYKIPQDCAKTDMVFISAPYPDIFSEYLSFTNSVLTNDSKIDQEIYNFYVGSQNVTTMNPGDIISFSLNNKIDLN